MKTSEARERAAVLGMSAWIAVAVAVDGQGREELVSSRCVGFASADFAIGRGETWDEALAEAARIVFGV